MVVFKILEAVDLEPELLIQNGISEVSSFHVLVRHGDWNDEINVEMVNDVCDQTEENYKAGVFEIGKLDVHCSKFNSPPDIRIL